MSCLPFVYFAILVVSSNPMGAIVQAGRGGRESRTPPRDVEAQRDNHDGVPATGRRGRAVGEHDVAGRQAGARRRRKPALLRDEGAGAKLNGVAAVVQNSIPHSGSSGKVPRLNTSQCRAPVGTDVPEEEDGKHVLGATSTA